MNREEIMNLVRDKLYEYGDPKILAEVSGLNVGTIYAIRSGRTVWPRPNTLFTLLPLLGLKFELVEVRKITYHSRSNVAVQQQRLQ
jgi:hypothetical protein